MKPGFKEIFTNSIRGVFYNAKFIILLWSLSAVTALVLSMPIYHMMNESLEHSVLSKQLAEGFDYIWLTQFLNINEGRIAGLPYLFFAALLIYLLIQNFFSGGLLAVFNFPKKNHTLDFFYGGVKYWLRFLTVLVGAILFYITAFYINDFLGYLIKYSFANSENAMFEFILKVIKYIILVLLIGITAIIADYTKVVIVCKEESGVLRSVKTAILFIRNNFNMVFTVFVLISITGAIGVLIYNAVGRFIPRTPYYFLILSFILQQMLIIFRMLIRMLFYASEVIVFKDLNAEVVEENTEEIWRK